MAEIKSRDQNSWKVYDFALSRRKYIFKKNIPNILTFTNLAFGTLSILEITKKNYFAAAIMIMIAALIDRYDGRAARHFNVSSEFGKELDSLADLVSFGIAPAFLIFSKYNLLNLGDIKPAGVCLLLIYIMSGTYRLARYNIGKSDGIFIGVPITIAGFILALYALFIPSNAISALGSAMLLLLLSYFMVSKIRFKKI